MGVDTRVSRRSVEFGRAQAGGGARELTRTMSVIPSSRVGLYGQSNGLHSDHMSLCLQN